VSNTNDHVSMAIFCDFENVALGVRDTKYQKFDIRPVLERLLLKGSIVVKKAYCDWERYKEFKAPMHEANFELIEIPHVRQSGKNSADIRLVVDALDFCYTKSHVNTFVIISGDSDFSPLVSKLRENNKTVIGVGVKQSTSDLLVANCDDFIFYDDIAREIQRTVDAQRGSRSSHSGPRRSPEEIGALRTEAIEMVVETFEALMAERGDSGKVWASVLKEALKRRRPDFNESYYGFRAFGNVLEEAQARGYLEVGRAENSSTYVIRSGTKEPAAMVPTVQTREPETSVDVNVSTEPTRNNQSAAGQRTRGPRTRGPWGTRRMQNRTTEPAANVSSTEDTPAVVASEVTVVVDAPVLEVVEAVPTAPVKRTNTRTRRSAPASKPDVVDAKETLVTPVAETVTAPVVTTASDITSADQSAPAAEQAAAPVKRARKTARTTTTRPRSPRKTATPKE
jgi:uncharacterized LabA/DUF88 family protein